MPIVTRGVSATIEQTATIMDPFAILDNLQRLSETVVRDNSEVVALNSKGMTSDHFSRGCRIVQSFLSGIGNMGKCLFEVIVTDTWFVLALLTLYEVTKEGTQVYQELLKPVDMVRRGQKLEVPAIVKLLAGEVDDTKVMIANRALVDWQLGLKLVKPNKSGCPWYAPTTQATDLRTFFAKMQKEYGWKLNEANFKGFDGCVHAVMAEAFQQREREWVSDYRLCFILSFIFYAKLS